MRLLPIDEYSTPSATFGHNRTSTILSDNVSFVSFPKSSSRQSLRRRALSAAHSHRDQGNGRSTSYVPNELDSDADVESFHRLPRISGVSSLRVSSLLQLPSSSVSLRSSIAIDLSHSGNLGPVPKPPKKKPSFGTLNIPSLMHPNSPYVPWSPPVREKILCPLPQDSEETGDNLPVRESSPPSEVKGPKNVFRRILNGTLRKAKRVTQYRARKQSPERNIAKEGGIHTTEMTSSPPIYTTSRRFSVASVRSYETHTLSIWLAERRQLLEVELDFTTPIDELFSHRDV